MEFVSEETSQPFTRYPQVPASASTRVRPRARPSPASPRSPRYSCLVRRGPDAPRQFWGRSCQILHAQCLQWERCILRTDSSKQGRQDLAHSKFSLEMVPTKSLSHGNRTFLATQALGCLSLMFPTGDRLKARSLWASSQQTQHSYVAPQELLPG